MKGKIVRVGRTYGLPNYSSVKIEWEVEIGVGETIMSTTEFLLDELDKLAELKGWKRG